MVRNLEEKGYVNHNAYGKTHEYFPLISKESYRAVYMGKAISDFFSDSYSSLVSQFAQEEKISVSELKEIIKLIEKKQIIMDAFLDFAWKKHCRFRPVLCGVSFLVVS